MCEIIGNDKLISSSITSLLAEPAGIQMVYEDYTRLFIGPNSLTAPLWESIYLDREH
ncbi:molecular chaperone TorD family protein [Bacillus spizizenii]|nr:molecular chaperone TorD family protein [Bacillus spizizenii]